MNVKAFVHKKLGNLIAEIEGKMYWLIYEAKRDQNGEYTIREKCFIPTGSPLALFENNDEFLSFVVDVESEEDDKLWNLRHEVTPDKAAVDNMIRAVERLNAEIL